MKWYHKLAEWTIRDRPFAGIVFAIGFGVLMLGIADWPNKMAAVDFLLAGWMFGNAWFWATRRGYRLHEADKAQIERDIAAIFNEVANQYGYSVKDGRAEQILPPSLRN